MSTTDLPPGAHVEIVDAYPASQAVLVPSRVLINGVDVGLLADDGVQLSELNAHDAVTVTLKLLPQRVTIRGAVVGKQ